MSSNDNRTNPRDPKLDIGRALDTGGYAGKFDEALDAHGTAYEGVPASAALFPPGSARNIPMFPLGLALKAGRVMREGQKPPNSGNSGEVGIPHVSAELMQRFLYGEPNKRIRKGVALVAVGALAAAAALRWYRRRTQ